MLTTGVRTTALWRLGVPAVLMVAFVLVGLARAPWRGDEAPRPVTAVTPSRVDATPAPGADHPMPAANATTEDADVREAPPGPERGATHEVPSPSDRLPAELEPVAPDVVVAMEPAGLPPVVMHSHLEGAPDRSPALALPEGWFRASPDEAPPSSSP